MKIRTIEPRDFATVATLENQNWPLTSTPHLMDSTAEKIIQKITSGGGYFLAEKDGEILGLLDFSPRHRSAFGQHVLTFGLMTVKQARHQGVATQLLRFFIDYARQEGYQKITIQVMGSNPAGLHLYKKLGFIEEGRLRKEFFIDGQYIDDYILAYYLDKNLL